jgi:hypothetical protein
MMRSGELWELPTPVLRIEGKGSGYWPTQVCSDSMNANPHRIEMRGHRPTTISSKGKTGTSGLNQWVKIYPEPPPSGNWPTPKACDGIVRHSQKWMEKKWNEGGDVDLTIAVKMWPTPRAANPGSRPNGKGGKILEEEVKIAEGDRIRGEKVTGQEVGGQLNPDWVEWLMNWPIGWTSMEPLNPDRFRAWLRAFPSVPTASKPSGTDKCQQP